MDLQTDSWLEAISDKKEDKEFGVQVRWGVKPNNLTLLYEVNFTFCKVNLNETWDEEDASLGLLPGLKRLEVRTPHTMQDKVISNNH